MLDRRQSVTGLGVVVAAGFAPALRACAATWPPRRFFFDWQPTYSCWRLTEDTVAAARALPNSVWLYYLGWNDPGGRWSIRHVASGLTFTFCQSEPPYPNSAVVDLAYLETRLDTVTVFYEDIHPIGYAAYEVVAAMRVLHREEQPAFGSTTGAILIRYRSWQLPDPLDTPFPLSFEDVPPWPSVSA